jgi:hypothetical protein
LGRFIRLSAWLGVVQLPQKPLYILPTWRRRRTSTSSIVSSGYKGTVADVLSGQGIRRRYSHCFCCFVADLAAERGDVALTDFAGVVQVSLGTLKDWLAGNQAKVEPPRTPTNPTIPTFFSGAQWGGDGTELEIELWGRRYRCNLELNVDTYSAAFVGASLRPTEDSQAVVEGDVVGL